ncbi:uncharacterized protein LOC134660983 [Cydia amplana]|uniref:uncharacterized protein LOC134660983 n=1 Tax=Cydia amplana TaxID=1869771 RepID=UPI002FE5CFC8
MASMRNDIELMQEQSATKKELDLLKKELDDLKAASLVNNYCQNVNSRRGACLASSFDYQSGPMGLPHSCNESLSPKEIQRPSVAMCPEISKSDCNKSQEGREIIMQSAAKFRPLPCQLSTDKDSAPSAITINERNNNEQRMHESGNSCISQLLPSKQCDLPASAMVAGHTGAAVDEQKLPEPLQYSEIAKRGEWKPQTKDEQWKTIERNRLKNKFIGNRGKATTNPSTKFKAADIKVPIYIYDVAKDTAMNDILDYIKSKTNVAVTLEKINMRRQKDYNAFKVYVPKHKLNIFLHDDFWPEGIAFRRFINFKNKNENSHGEFESQKT